MKRLLLRATVLSTVAVALCAAPAPAARDHGRRGHDAAAELRHHRDPAALRRIGHIVVYEENHSFDNLYGG